MRRNLRGRRRFAVVTATEDPQHCILSTHLHADGRFAEELYVKDPGKAAVRAGPVSRGAARHRRV